MSHFREVVAAALRTVTWVRGTCNWTQPSRASWHEEFVEEAVLTDFGRPLLSPRALSAGLHLTRAMAATQALLRF